MTYNTGLARKGPGLLLRDLTRFEEPDIQAVVARITRLQPDVLALQSFDYDAGGLALRQLQKRLDQQGHAMPFAFARRPNSGVSSGIDIDRDEKHDTPRDAQGFGQFLGQGGVAILSRFPIDQAEIQDYSSQKWADSPAQFQPQGVDGPYFSDQELEQLALHSVGAWKVSIVFPKGDIQVITTQTSPPVFDGIENRNGLRNAGQIDAIRRIVDMLDKQAFVVLASLNNDPADGEGLKRPLVELLSHPSLQDVRPRSEGGRLAADAQHGGDPGLDTVDWDMPPGNLRVDYVLPSTELIVRDSAVDWLPADPAGSKHHPVWVDLMFQ